MRRTYKSTGSNIRDALNNMLDVCRKYAEAYDILFYATKTKCMFLIELIVLGLIKMFNSWEAP